MTAQELRQKYLKFFESKGHTIIPSASLIPENDPSVLFTTAGMHPLVPYLFGEKHPGGKKLTNVQKCVRTGDIDEVGDTIHHTFFEMLGNWSLGEYFKEESIEMSWEFLTSEKWLNLDKNRLAVSVFAGDKDSPFDEEAFNLWKNIFEKNNLPMARIAKLPKKNNWWGMEKGPCGPDTEIFYWANNEKAPESFNDDNEKWVEIWNNVFLQYNKISDGKYEPLKQKNVDTGMGLERTLAAINGLDDNYKTDLFLPIIEKIQEISGKKYEGNEKSFRIIADHLKAATFIISDGVEPSNKDRGYVLRRLIRKVVAIFYIYDRNIDSKEIKSIVQVIFNIYKDTYHEFKQNEKCADILEKLSKEIRKFRATIENGFKELDKLELKIKNCNKDEWNYLIAGKVAFDFYQSYGFPIEIFLEELEKRKIPYIDNKEKIIEEFKKNLEIHQDKSRTASAGMFKGGLADTSEKTVQYHTVAHLMLAALRHVLGNHVMQKGSNITAERLRFDFSHPDKMTDGQKAEVEKIVNMAIEAHLDVVREEMTLDDARKTNAMGVFDAKYGDKVSVFSIVNDDAIIISREICGGPHVKNTGELGHFKIQKEESSSAGVRRIKAILG